jgi:long-chain acyl-CoA synthetase
MNLAGVIEGHPSDAPALVSRGQVTTYGDLRSQVAELRGGLTRLGLQPGDRVALVLPNNWFFVTAYLAALGVGAVVVPLNPTSPPAELQAELAVVRPKVLIAGAAGATGVNGTR